MKPDGLDEVVKNKIIGLLLVLFPHAKIYLYGSRARGDFKERSDIDIALDAGPAPERLNLGEARTVLEGTRIPYKIDLIDLNFVQKELRETILHEGVLWYPIKHD